MPRTNISTGAQKRFIDVDSGWWRLSKRSRSSFRLWTIALFGLSVVPTLHAQAETQQRAEDSTFVIRQNVEEVLLYCTVTDAKGVLITDLLRSAFHVREEKRDVLISHFSRGDVPVSLSLILDDSGSMREKRPAVQAAALALIRASNPMDETSITNFADSPYLDQGLTTDLASLQKALDQSKTVSGGTALFDTLASAADYLTKNAHHSKQVIVVVTDGKDNASVTDLASAIHRVQRADGPVIYAIGLLYDVPYGEARRARKDLAELADQTGGIAFFPASLKQVDSIAAEVARDIRNQYTISFHPSNQVTADGYHLVTVKAVAPNKGSLTVRTRKGYTRSVPGSIKANHSTH